MKQISIFMFWLHLFLVSFTKESFSHYQGGHFKIENKHAQIDKHKRVR